VTTDIPSDPDTIIWADLGVLQKHHDISIYLLRQQRHLVLVPYKDKTSLDEILGPMPLTNIMPIRKPLIWHSIVQTIIDTQDAQRASDHNEDILLATNPDVTHKSASEIKKQAPVVKRRTVLLVEDNKVCRQYSY
jgi:hypothetical protein